MTLDNLLDLSLSKEKFSLDYNKKLIDKFILINHSITSFITKFPSIRFNIIYSTKGDTSEIHHKIKSKSSNINQNIEKSISESKSNFKFWGAEELLSEARRQPKTAFKLNTTEGFSPNKGLYIALVKLNDYYTFIKNEDNEINKSIFESNVRDYQGNITVNQEIKDTLVNKNAVEDFWWLNNGVTIIASQISISGKEIAIENPEIVNGLQTSNEIFNYYKNGGNDEKRSILVRVICPDSEDSRDKIIKATNSQTIIPNVSLRGTDRIHRDIEDFFLTKGLYYERRKNYYKNQGKSLSKIISISYLGQSLMSILLEKPDTARARPSTLLSKDEEYNKLFSKDTPLETYYKCVMILRLVENHLKNIEACETSIKSDLKYYVALYISYKLCNDNKPSKDSISNINLDSIKKDLIDECFSKIYDKYMDLGGTNKIAKGTDLITWLKNEVLA